MISKENFDKFFEYINNIYENYDKLTIKKNLSNEEKILTNLSCLVEETGELSSEIRKFTKLSFNQKKVDSFEMKNLEEEFADVLITAFLLGKSLGIENIDEFIKRKIEKNNNRGY